MKNRTYISNMLGVLFWLLVVAVSLPGEQAFAGELSYYSVFSFTGSTRASNDDSRVSAQRDLLSEPQFIESLRFLSSDIGILTRASSFGEQIRDSYEYYRDLPGLFSRQIRSLVRGFGQVKEIMDMEHGLLEADHPWVTGELEGSEDPIWFENVVYRTAPENSEFSDDTMLRSVGKYMTTMVKKSVGPQEIPRGLKRRMPHAINYVHGSSHYNSAILIFNNLQEGFDHFGSSEFRNELFRFVKDQNREVLLFFRDRDYSEAEYAMFVVYLRTRLPWFLNSDGPKKNVLWGNKSPYAVVNLITEEWAKDLFALKGGDINSIVRPPIQSEGYFDENSYISRCSISIRWPERLLALYSRFRILCRGTKGNHSLVDRREVDRPGRENYRIHDFLSTKEK